MEYFIQMKQPSGHFCIETPFSLDNDQKSKTNLMNEYCSGGSSLFSADLDVSILENLKFWVIIFFS